MRGLFISSIGLALGSIPMAAHATSIQIDADLDDFTDSSDGKTLTKTTAIDINATGSLKGWDLSMTVSYVHMDAEAASPRDPQLSREIGDSRYQSGPSTAGLTDVKIAAERSVPLARGVSLDLLARATLPTGKASTYLGRGRFELMLDAGLSTHVGTATIWAGGARRFRSQGYESTGRDVYEVYAGMKRPLGTKATVRVDYVRTQPEYRNQRFEQSTSVGLSRRLKSSATLDISASHYRNAYYKEVQTSVSLRWPIQRLI
ncbi:MAG: hypothetical protein ABI668_05085 [Sphingorhabdus sp.]